jgi:predicted enzyme related to lactoylglutathione lyase
MAIPTGRFVWFDYVVPDVKKAQGFYGELFNWSTQDVPMAEGAYTMISANGKTQAGYLPTPQGAPKTGHWLPHLQVESAAATSAKIKSLGGKVRMEPKQLGEHGTMAVVADDLDGTFCLWQPAHATGTGDWSRQNGAFCWVELQTQSPAKSIAFYKAIGGFTEQHSDAMPDYAVLTSDGQMRAGINKPPMQAPQAWVPYVQVASCDASLDKAKKLGATVLVPAMEATGVGRFAIFSDPQGGVIGILQPSA